jgi:hypothetical protein
VQFLILFAYSWVKELYSESQFLPLVVSYAFDLCFPGTRAQNFYSAQLAFCSEGLQYVEQIRMFCAFY